MASRQVGIFIGCLVAFISLVGSLMIIIAVATSKQNRANTQQRILAIMSTSDFLFAAAFILTFAIPHHGRKSQDVVCEIKGFVFMLFGTITNLYNASLATYYLLTIRYNYGNRKIKTLENWLHIPPIAFGLLYTIIGASVNVINPMKQDETSLCAIVPDESLDPSDHLYKLGVYFAIFSPLVYIIVLLFNLICYVLIYKHVKMTERRSSRFSMVIRRNPNSMNELLQTTRKVATQCKLFFLAFLVPWLLSLLEMALLASNVDVPTWLNTLALILLPSAGFFNTIVYFRLRYTRLSEENPERKGFSIVLGIVFNILFPCYQRRDLVRAPSLEDNFDLEPEIWNSTPSDNEAPATARMFPINIAEDQGLGEGRDRSDSTHNDDRWKLLRASGVKVIRKQSSTFETTDIEGLHSTTARLDESIEEESISNIL